MNEDAASDRNKAILRELQRYWDDDSETYDYSPQHAMHTSTQRAAWNEVFFRLLPPPPARVLDLGAGTGFLALALARLGFRVTAIDLSPAMLERLRIKAAAEGLEIKLVEGEAESPPPGPFDAVVERLLLWTLLDPVQALTAAKQVAPAGRLVSFGGIWGGFDPVEAVRARLRNGMARIVRLPAEHHGPYPKAFLDLPRAFRADPESMVNAIEAAGWRSPRLERLRDVEWAETLARPPSLRPLGSPRRIAIVADA